jgi:hypothetical protein
MHASIASHAWSASQDHYDHSHYHYPRMIISNGISGLSLMDKALFEGIAPEAVKTTELSPTSSDRTSVEGV